MKVSLQSNLKRETQIYFALRPTSTSEGNTNIPIARRQEGTQMHILPNVSRGNTNKHFASLLDGTSAHLHLAFLNGIDKSSLVFSILD
ncbi:1564_t:CDS:2, partial [Funneliformis mosseae]